MSFHAPGQPSGSAGGQLPVCPRHPDRPSFVRCQRCGRPACPECQRTAAVGVQCVDCVAAAEQGRFQPLTTTAAPGFGQPSGRPAGHPGRAGRGRSLLRNRAGGSTPWVTYTLIALCAVMYVLQMLDESITEQFWYAGVHTSALASEPWRMLTSAFLHSPTMPAHILFNMFTLWMFGQALEPALGRLRFLVLYLVSAFGGSVAVLWLSDPLTPVVGASGAVYGLFAPLFMVLRASGGQIGSIVVLIAVNLGISFLGSNISWQGHIGGLVTGALVGAAMVYLPRWTASRNASHASGVRVGGGPGTARTGVALEWSAIALVVVLLVVLTLVGASQLTMSELLSR